MQNHPEITEDHINAILQTVASTGNSITRDEAIQFIKNTYAELEMEKTTTPVTSSVVEMPPAEQNWKNRIKNLQNNKS